MSFLLTGRRKLRIVRVKDEKTRTNEQVGIIRCNTRKEGQNTKRIHLCMYNDTIGPFFDESRLSRLFLKDSNILSNFGVLISFQLIKIGHLVKKIVTYFFVQTIVTLSSVSLSPVTLQQ